MAKTDYEICPTEWTSGDWYRSTFKNIRQYLITQKLVLNVGREYLKLSEALFPTYHGKEKLYDFWDICNEFIPNKIPQKQDISVWNKIINSDYSTWQADFKYDLEKLLEDISTEGSITQLAENRFSSSINNAISWLNKVIGFIFTQAEKPELLQKYAILPNKKGAFMKVAAKNSLLHSDFGSKIPDKVIEIYKSLGNKDWSDFLLHPSIIIADISEIPKYGIVHITQDIDNIISDRNANQGVLRKAVYQIISYYTPPLTDNTEYSNWRKNLWQFAKDLDNSVPDFEALEGLRTTFWNNADNWLLSTLVYDIQTTQNIENLKSKLSFEDIESSLHWLSNFINFYIQNKKETYYSEKSIFPNQKGVFRKKQEVFFDNEIAEQLKGVLDRFTHSKEIPLYWSFTNILLDKSIKGFEKHQSKSTKDISDKINELIKFIIKNDLTNIEKDTSAQFKKVFFDLVSFGTKAQHTNREQLREFSHAIFNENVGEKSEMLTNMDDFDFSLANEWILTALVEKIQGLKTLENLQELNAFFQEKSKSQVIEWLDSFIYFVANFEDEKHVNLLNKFSFIPNQNNNFCNLKSLKRDDNIPTDLKEIANAKHIRQDWNEWLLHKNLKNVFESLFDETTTQSLKHIADEIDGHVRDYKGDKQDMGFSELVFLLNQSETVRQDKEIKHFPFFLNNKDMLIVGTLGEGQDLENVSTILQDREKLDIFAKIANTGITTAHLEMYKNAVELVGAENITLLIQEEKEEKEKINFHTELGNLAEQIFKAELEKEGFEVDRTGYGSDFSISRGSHNCLVEIKSFVEGFENAVKMTPYQVRTAISSENYVLCVFPKTSTIPTEIDFRKKAQFVSNIAENLKSIEVNAQELEKQRSNAISSEIGLIFEKWEYKYKVSKPVWSMGKNLDSFINHLTTK